MYIFLQNTVSITNADFTYILYEGLVINGLGRILLHFLLF